MLTGSTLGNNSMTNRLLTSSAAISNALL